MVKNKSTKPKYNNFFIVGCNRSGTSLLRTMLNHHSKIAVPLESLFLVDYLKADGAVDIELQKKLLKGEPMLKEWGVDLNNSELNKIKNTTDIFQVVHQTYAKNENKTIWGNKTPRMTRYINDVKKYLPDVVFIHVVRDPRAVALSLTKSNIHKSNVYFGAKRWVRYLTAALEAEKNYDGDVLRIYYEDLVNNPVKELKKVCKLIGVNYQKSMLDYQKTGNKEYRKYHHGAHRNLNKAPQKDRINAWKEVLTEKEIKLIEHICSDLMDEFGYDRLFEDSDLKNSEVYFYRLERVYGFSLQFMRYVFLWPSYLLHTLWRKIRLGTFIEELLGINY